MEVCTAPFSSVLASVAVKDCKVALSLRAVRELGEVFMTYQRLACRSRTTQYQPIAERTLTPPKS